MEQAYERLEVKPLPPSIANGTKAKRWAMRTFFLGLLMIVAYGVYWIYPETWWPINPVDYCYINLHTKTVKAGQAIKYDLYMNKHHEAVPFITREFVSVDNKYPNLSATEMTMGSTKSSLTWVTPSGLQVKPILIGTPTWMPPGEWYVKATVVYPLQGGRNIPAPYRTHAFSVSTEVNVKAEMVEAQRVYTNKLSVDEIEARGKIKAAEVEAEKVIERERSKARKVEQK